jgi:transcriptional regulator with XRE-family HTH domain
MEIFLSSNIKLLRKRKKKTQDDVASMIGIKRVSYTGIELGNSFPGIEVLLKLSDYFAVSVDSLLRIDLAQLSGFQLSELERGNDVFIRGTNLRVLATSTDDNDDENIELVPEKAKAGYTTGYADPEYISELPRFQLPFLSKEKKYRAFQIKGDSMLPIREGAWIVCEFVLDWHSILSGKPYILLTYDEGVVFKIVDNLIQDEGILRLFSLNPIYEPYDVKITDVREVWSFVNYISDEIPEYEDSNIDLEKKVDELSKDLELIKLRLGKK